MLGSADSSRVHQSTKSKDRIIKRVEASCSSQHDPSMNALVTFIQAKSNFLKVFTNSLKQPVLPRLSLLSQIEIKSVELLLEWIGDYLSPENDRKVAVSAHSLLWVYAILTILKWPAEEDIGSHLAKILTSVSKSLSAPFHSERDQASHKAIMVIIINYFLSHKFFV